MLCCPPVTSLEEEPHVLIVFHSRETNIKSFPLVPKSVIWMVRDGQN